MVITLPFSIGETFTLKLRNVLYCPKMTQTLVSIGRLDAAGYTFEIGKGCLLIYSPTRLWIGKILRYRHLYSISPSEFAYAATPRTVTPEEAHRILGHMNYSYIRKLFHENKIKGLELSTHFPLTQPCDICKQGKAIRAKVDGARQSQLSQNFGDMFHMDV